MTTMPRLVKPLDTERVVTAHWVLDGLSIGVMTVSPFVTHSTTGQALMVDMVGGIGGAMVSVCTRYLRWYRSGLRSNITVAIYLMTNVSLLLMMLSTMHDGLSHHPDWAMPWIDAVLVTAIMLIRGIFSMMDREQRHTAIEAEFIREFEPCGVSIHEDDDDEWE